MDDKEIAEILSRDNEEYKKLSEEHKSLETQLSELTTKVYLTQEEEVEKKRIQKLKLVKKDKMAELIRSYKKKA